MNRSTVAAVLAAAVVGIAGGTASAVLHGGDAHPAAPSARAAGVPGGPGSAARSSSPSPSSDDPELTNEPLLYVADGMLRDGAGRFRFAPPGEVTQVARVGDGFLVSTLVPSEDRTLDLWFLDVHDEAHHVAVVSRWDVDATGERVTAYDVEAGAVTVWAVPSRKVIGRYATEGDPRLSPAFAGHDVVIAQDLGSRTDLVRWNPETGTSSPLGTGYEDQSLSPGGSYLAGSVGPDGLSAGRDGGVNGCLHVESTYLKQQRVDWRTCDWRILGDTAHFSPDGTRLVAVSTAPGSGPPEVAAIDASDGPQPLVGSFRLPARTRGVVWADNDHLYVYGVTAGDPAARRGWVQRCDLTGDCRTVARTSGPVLVGAGT